MTFTLTNSIQWVVGGLLEGEWFGKIIIRYY